MPQSFSLLPLMNNAVQTIRDSVGFVVADPKVDHLEDVVEADSRADQLRTSLKLKRKTCLVL